MECITSRGARRATSTIGAPGRSGREGRRRRRRPWPPSPPWPSSPSSLVPHRSCHPSARLRHRSSHEARRRLRRLRPTQPPHPSPPLLLACLACPLLLRCGRCRLQWRRVASPAKQSAPMQSPLGASALAHRRSRPRPNQSAASGVVSGREPRAHEVRGWAEERRRATMIHAHFIPDVCLRCDGQTLRAAWEKLGLFLLLPQPTNFGSFGGNRN